jgi:voltage-gated potassium channel
MQNSLLLKSWNFLLTLLAVSFLIAFSWPAFDLNPSTEVIRYLELVQWVSWVAFAVDLALGFVSSKDRKKYLIKHPLEIIAVALPMLRPLRLLRVISFSSLVLEKIAIGRSVGIAVKVALTTLFFGYIAAVQITILERGNPEANIRDFGDGIWWAFTTITTVGYGDRFPITGEGRFLAVGLMILGISLLGVVSATIAAWFVKMMQDDSSKVNSR